MIYWRKDLGRTIDFLETRKDLNLEKLAYYGLSTGAYLGNILPAVESRIRVAVLLGGGFEFGKKMPEVDELNFAPRVKVPTLLVDGRYDEFFPLKTSQNVMFRFLGQQRKTASRGLRGRTHPSLRPDGEGNPRLAGQVSRTCEMSSAVQPTTDRK